MVQATERPGLDLSVRFAFELPLGDLQKGAPLSEGLSGAVPFIFELAPRVNMYVSVGLAVEWARALTNNCTPGFSCSATDYHLGAEATFTARSQTGLDPWLGLGLGYEWLEVSESGSDGSASGWTYEVIAVGAEMRAGVASGIGPFASLSLGQFSSTSSDYSSRDITNPALHEWLQFGLRGTLHM